MKGVFRSATAIAIVLACAMTTNPTSAGDAILADPSGTISIPFELYFNLIMIRVGVNGGPPRDFLLDTGFQFHVLNSDRCAALGLEPRATGTPKR